MPKAVSGYKLQLCRTDVDLENGCKAETFLNHSATDGLQLGTFADLEAEAAYTYKVIPIIIDGPKNYTGSPLTGSFRTAAVDYPMVHNLSAKYEERNSTLSGIFVWEVSKPDIIQTSRYLVTVEPCKTNCMRITYTSAADFTDLDFSSNIRLEVLVDFVVDGKIRSKRFIFNVTTPNFIAPIEALEIARMSPSEVIFRWAATERPSDYEIAICDVAECLRRRQEIPEIHLITQKPGALYDVEIIVHQGNFTAEYFKGPLQMLEKDYEAPGNLSVEVEERHWNRVTYSIQALIAEDASSFEVEACSLGEKRADCSHDRVRNTGRDQEVLAKLTLEYFTPYEVVCIVVYELPLGKEVRKSSKQTMRTVGTDPVAVESIVASGITSDSLHLRWEPPRNIPLRENLTISYEISTDSRNWTVSEPNLRVSNLEPFTEYRFDIRAIVKYFEESHEGKVAYATFKTDAGRPGKVTNLQVVQRVHSPIVKVMWGPPAEAHGEVKNYELDFGSLAPNATERRVRVNSTETNVTLPVTQNGDLYSFRVAAVTESSEGAELVGEMSQVNVTVPGIGVTFNVSLIGRTCNSLQVLLESSEDGKRPRSLFYMVTDYKGRTIKRSLKIINITDLRTYHHESLTIRACFEDDFCTQEKVFEALTDVDAPSAVVDLKAVVLNRTNVEIAWNQSRIKNGPIDATVVEVIDETDEAVRFNSTTNTTRFVFNSTDEFETFLISVTPSNNRVGDPSKRVFGPTETIRIRTSGFSVPKVENLRISRADATEITLKWDKARLDTPANDTFYEVEVLNSKLDGVTTRGLSATISGMKPFTNFSVGVKTCIGDLSSHSCGLTRKAYGKTDSAAPSEPRNLAVRILDKYTMIVTWESPEQPNGEIAGYHVSIKNTTDTVNPYVDGSCHQFRAENLNPSGTYELALAAFTFNTHHDRLESKSAIVKFSLDHSVSTLTIVLIIAMSFLLIAAAVGGVWWSCRGRAVPYVEIGHDP